MNYRTLNSQLVVANYERSYPWVVKGQGARLFDDAGRAYLDASGCTAAVTHIGHGVTEIAEALAQQARTLAVHPTHIFHSPVVEEYFEKLCAFAPDGFTRAWTVSGGTEAVENAVKLAFQYHRAKGRSTRKRVIARWGSYHGNSITNLDFGGMVPRRSFYTAMMPDGQHLHASPCLSYRRQDSMSERDYEDQLVAEFQDLVQEHEDEIMCFVAEPIVGAALGAAGPTPQYFERIAKICRAHDILLVADEVMTGFGRTGRNFGCEYYGTHADILACAKGISGGYLPLGALLVREEVAQTLKESGDPFWSGQTYTCIPLAAAVGTAVLSYIQDHELVQRAATTGAHLKAKLQGLGDLDCVGDVRGEGLFLGIEFVQDKATKAPFAPELGFAKRVEAHALELGAVTYACRGTVEGTRGDHMLFAPPLVLSTAEADELATIMRTAIERAMNSLSPARHSGAQ